MRYLLTLLLAFSIQCAHAQSVGNASNFVVGSPPSGGGCCTLVAHTIATSTASTNSVTTSGINTTGANLEIVTVAHFGTATTPTITDSLSNTWTKIYDTSTAVTDSVGIWYSFNPITGSSQTFTVNSNSNYSVINVSAFSGASVGYDSPNTNHNSSASAANLTTGSVTPSSGPALLVTGAEGHQFRPATIDSSFTITDNATSSNGVHMAGGMAYLVESTATAKNPTWGYGSANQCIAVIAVFR